jgi:hypothetical protein
MTVQVWHDEMERWERTGRLDQGPCWCADCLATEARARSGETYDHRHLGPIADEETSAPDGEG